MKLAGLDLDFHPEGYPFMAGAVVIAALLGLLGCPFFFLGVALVIWCVYFFRDPPRVTPIKPGLIISPADGKVVAIRDVEPDEELGLGTSPRTRISIFLNVFDVHVNRVPADGVIKTRHYRAGAFLNAALDKASTDNERMALAIELSGDGPHAKELLGVVQIAGLVARRIVCTANEGESFRAGQRYGIIRFGSRVDVYLPHGVAPFVAVGQYMIGGETVLADCASSEPVRVGKQRE